MEFEDITYSTSGGIARITINRPERRNALRIQTYEELAQALELADADGHVGVVMLSGAGDTTFSSGPAACRPTRAPRRARASTAP